MTRLLYIMLTGALLAPAFTTTAYAGDRDKRGRADHRSDARHDRGDRHGRDRDHDRWDRDNRPDRDRYYVDVRESRRYFGPRDVVVVRDYYRPHHRPLPRGLRTYYARHGHLPPGWARKIRPVPVYVERQLLPLPRGYSRGIIDGHLVVHNSSGFILDVAVLF